MTWVPVESGQTIGQKGSEEGVILKDEVLPGHARITLERINFYAITAGLYGVLVHTTFDHTLSGANDKYAAMKIALENAPEDVAQLADWCDQFVHQF